MRSEQEIRATREKIAAFANAQPSDLFVRDGKLTPHDYRRFKAQDLVHVLSWVLDAPGEDVIIPPELLV